ncbi:MAG: CinA family protein [Clostridia bacterium]|nr:CinA family protein [Clostridia bacterium]
MKFAAIILFNKRSPLSIVDYPCVTDALLSGGVFLEELVLLPYDAPSALTATITRLAMHHEGVFVIAEGMLLPEVKKAVEISAGAHFAEEDFLETANCFYGVLSTGMDGANLVKERLIPRINRWRKQTFFRVVLCMVGAPREHRVAAMERAQAAAPGLIIHATEKYGEARIEIIYDQTTPKFIVDEATRILADELKEYLYALEDVSVAQRLVEALKIRRCKISVAESFTGGGVGRALVRVPGASAVYFEGLNTYHENAKQSRLGVTAFTIQQRGTVSEETAYEMAVGLLSSGSCDLALTTTGVAGPDPDEKGHPAGTCYIAVGTKEQVKVYPCILSGDRETIIETAVNLALFLAYKELK